MRGVRKATARERTTHQIASFPPPATGRPIDHYKQGITQGWGDVYDWYIPDQYIEVTGVPNGYYLLEFCAGPFNEINEENEHNNCIVNYIRLTGMEGPNKAVDVLRSRW